MYSIPTNLTDVIKIVCFKQAGYKSRESDRGNIIFNEGYDGEEVILKDRKIFLQRMTYNEA